jgi:hypothetical protein
MKTIALAILALALPIGAAHAQTCRTFGGDSMRSYTTCSDGWSARRMGNDTYINPPEPGYTDWTQPTAQPTYRPYQPPVVCRTLGTMTGCN